MEILHREFDAQKTKNSFKNVAWFYDLWGKFTESKANQKALNLLDIKDNQKILDIGCGTGSVLQKIGRQNPNGENIGIDLSSRMLQKAGKKLESSEEFNFRLMEGNVLDLDFPNGVMDRIVCNYVVDLMPETAFDRIASEIYRITVSGGIVVISTFSFGQSTVHRFWYWLAKQMPGLLTGCRPVSFKEPLTKAGFVIEESVFISQNTFPSEVIKARKPG